MCKHTRCLVDLSTMMLNNVISSSVSIELAAEAVLEKMVVLK